MITVCEDGQGVCKNVVTGMAANLKLLISQQVLTVLGERSSQRQLHWEEVDDRYNY